MGMSTKGGVSLYRFYDAEDTLLYVGITEAGAMRWLDGTNWSAFVYRAVTGLRGAT